MKSIEKTKVIFRKWPKPEGGVIAIFPEELGDSSPYTCSSYEHIGQHGACEPVGLIMRTKLATPSESRALAKELKRIGYNLEIITRYRYSFLETRKSSYAKQLS